jgi:hypothetical protein
MYFKRTAEGEEVGGAMVESKMTMNRAHDVFAHHGTEREIRLMAKARNIELIPGNLKSCEACTTTGRRHRRQARQQVAANATPVVTDIAPAFSACTSEVAIAVAEGLSLSHHYALHGNAFNPDTGQIAEYPELSRCSEGHVWHESNAKEIGRLAQGYKNIVGTNTIFFIRRHDIPKGRKPTYLRIVAAYRPEKRQPHRIRWTAGGDRVDYPGDTSTKTADLTTVKWHVNSVISTDGARYMTGDLKDFYLGTPMEHYEYM